MKKLKILVATLLSVFLFTSANAGELTVTGAVKASITTAGSDNAAGASTTGDGQSLAISNDIDFGASGELDNGIAWAWQTQLDGGVIDDSQLTFATPYGSIGLYVTEGGYNFKHGGSQMALGYGSQIGNSAGFLDPDDASSFNNVAYATPAGMIPFGVVAKVAMTMGSGGDTNNPGDSTLGTAATETNGRNYSLEASPLEGLTLGASYFTVTQEDNTAEKGQKEENGAYYVAYKMGPVGVGYSKALIAPASGVGANAATYNAYENTSYSIGFVVNESLSVSYGVEKSHRNKTTDATEDDIKIDTIQAAYTMGGMTATVGLKDIENGNYTANENTNEAHLVLSMAF
jgi:hypothetical protein